MANSIANDDKISFYEASGIELPKELVDFIAQWKEKPGNLIAILHKVQDHYGYVPRRIAMKLSSELDQPLARIYGVLTFYHYFKLRKPGKFKVQMCTGTACYLKGSFDLLHALEELIGAGVNTSTKDGLFSVEVVRCIGCCGLAPAMVINGEVFGEVKEDQLAEIIGRYRNKEMEGSANGSI